MGSALALLKAPSAGIVVGALVAGGAMIALGRVSQPRREPAEPLGEHLTDAVASPG
jgi:hypothetical protein